MKMRYWIAATLMICFPFFNDVAAQGKGKQNGKEKKHHKVKGTPPGWAKKHGYHNDYHVYFPDYYTFYEPGRGYVYWNDGNWVASPSLPPFLKSVDLTGARIQILRNEPLSAHPEVRYHNFIDQYPARTIGIAIPIPPRKK